LVTLIISHYLFTVGSPLQVLRVDIGHKVEDVVPSRFSLLSNLISRSWPFRRVKIPAIRHSSREFGHSSEVILPNMDVFRLIHQNHRQHGFPLPTVSMDILSLDMFTIITQTLHIFEELIGMKFNFRKLSLQLCEGESEEDTPEVVVANGKKLLDAANTWLDFQSKSLVGLQLQQFISTGTVILPTFPYLTVLTISMDKFDETDNHVPIRPFTANQFPVLREVRLHDYRNNCIQIFAQADLPSVKYLGIHSFTKKASFVNPAWKRIMPNITNFHYGYAGPQDDDATAKSNLKTLAFVLIYYPELTLLRLDLSGTISNAEKKGLPNYWDILTGGAFRPLDTKTLLFGEIKSKYFERGEPVSDDDGVYRLPSLRNMKGKHTPCTGNIPLPRIFYRENLYRELVTEKTRYRETLYRERSFPRSSLPRNSLPRTLVTENARYREHYLMISLRET